MENVDKFIDQIIDAKQLPGLNDEVRSQLKDDLRRRLMDQIDRAAVTALSDEKAEELSKKLDDENFTPEDAAKFMQESGVDLSKVTLETMIRFRMLYLGTGEQEAE